tara:strand:+ start:411 stop:680 length:270 start_codon:yes stop_codon:yes gene_type:complete
MIKYIEIEPTYSGKTGRVKMVARLDDKVNEFLYDKKESDLISYEVVDEKFKCFYRANKTREQFKKPIPPPPPRDRLIKEGAIPPKPKQR